MMNYDFFSAAFLAIAIMLTACESTSTPAVAEVPHTNPPHIELTPVISQIGIPSRPTNVDNTPQALLSLTPDATKTQPAAALAVATVTSPAPTVPPTFVAVLPDISPSKCLLKPERNATQLMGLWFRWLGPDREGEYEKLYFRNEHDVSIWRGGYAAGLGHIEPFIADGTYTFDNTKHISLNTSSWVDASLDYNVCGDLLAAFDSANPGNGVYGYVRIAEWCWDIPDSYPDACYPDR